MLPEVVSNNMILKQTFVKLKISLVERRALTEAKLTAFVSTYHAFQVSFVRLISHLWMLTINLKKLW